MRAALARQPRRRLIAGGAVGFTALVIVVIVLAAPGSGGAESNAATNSTATTEVRRQDLVEVSSEDGTLGYGDSREVVNRLSGTVTWLPDTGKVVEPNGILYRVDGSPVILMDGRVPAYRPLSSSVSDGADVEQLERDLRALGYDDGGAIDVDDSWDSGTTAAVLRWQEDHGFDETGSIELGRIVFQPGPRRVSKVDATLGADGSSSGGQSDSSSGSNSSSSSSNGSTDGASTTTGAGRTQFASYTPSAMTAQTTTPQTTTPDTTAEEEAAKRKAAEEKAKREAAKRRAAEKEVAKLKAEQKRAAQQQQSAPQGGGGGAATASGAASSGGSGSSSGSASGSSGATASSPIMTTTSTTPVVTVNLDTTKQSLARQGARVTVDLPSGDTADGKIESVGKVATSSSSDGESNDQSSSATATIDVTVRLAKRAKALDQAPVTVNFEQSRRRDVLAIPVTALLARAGGKFAVEVRDGDGRRLVPVEPGLYADGYVEITGSGLRPGTKVTDARV